jgi:glycerol-3-phosphate acyltransferase PlsY
MPMSLPIFVLVAGLSYLLGSIPFGLLLTRAFGAGDLRKIGSGNIGATNVLRTGRRELAAATLVLDGGKGAVAVLIAGGLFGPDAAIIASGCAVLGHLFPVWLRFQGGKGVATTLGVLLAVAPFTGIGACLIWLAVAVLSRFSSLAALVAIGTAPLTAWLLYDPERAGLALFLAILVFLRHHENIARLRAGKESPIKLSRSA